MTLNYIEPHQQQKIIIFKTKKTPPSIITILAAKLQKQMGTKYLLDHLKTTKKKSKLKKGRHIVKLKLHQAQRPLQ